MEKSKENKTSVEPALLSIKQAAQFLNLHPGTIYNGIAPNTTNPFPVPVKRIGRRVLFRKKDLEAYVDSL